MSGDLTARDVIANAVAENHERGIRPTTDAVLAALAAAGWRLERDDQALEDMPIKQRDRLVAQTLTFMRDRGYRVTMPTLDELRAERGEVVPDA